MRVGDTWFSSEPFSGQNSYFEFFLNVFGDKIDCPKIWFLPAYVMNVFTICAYILDACQRYVIFMRTIFCQNSYFEFFLNAFGHKIDSPKIWFFVNCMMTMCSICAYILLPVGDLRFSSEQFSGQNSYFEFCLDAFGPKIDSPKIWFFEGGMLNMCTICAYILDACRRYEIFKRTIFWS